MTKAAPTFSADYIKKCQDAAQAGNVIAQNTLGFIFLNGQGLKKDYKQAANWFSRAANQRYAPAQFNLAIMYKLGQGVDKSHPESVKWMQLAANQNHAEAQSHLGNMYYQGLAVMQDYEMAYMWWSLAEENGEKELEHNKSELLKKMTESQISNAKQAIKQWVNKH